MVCSPRKILGSAKLTDLLLVMQACRSYVKREIIFQACSLAWHYKVEDSAGNKNDFLDGLSLQKFGNPWVCLSSSLCITLLDVFGHLYGPSQFPVNLQTTHIRLLCFIVALLIVLYTHGGCLQKRGPVNVSKLLPRNSRGMQLCSLYPLANVACRTEGIASASFLNLFY